ncbi:hypothetical protein DFQ30_006803 [Apophysomyces sp. BC1015]|nr:hypothetical protein DFQ30_006803 [Apophysomyces sp. BC1015]
MAASPASNKKKDAFADLLDFPQTRREESPQLSLAEQQRLSGRNIALTSVSSTPPYLTPVHTAATSPIPQRHSPLSPSPVPSPKSTYSAPSGPAKKAAVKDFDSLLSPFDKQTKATKDSSNLPLNVLRSQGSSTPSSEQEASVDQWNFDLFESKSLHEVSTPASAPVLSTSNTVADPFDVDVLASSTNYNTQQQHQDAVSYEEENPLGILAGPAVKPRVPSPERSVSSVSNRSETRSASPKPGRKDDGLLAQLIDMGFELESATVALEATGGKDLQAAVDLLVQNSEVMQHQAEVDTGRSCKTTFIESPETPVRHPRRTMETEIDTPSSRGSETERSDDSFLQHKERIVAHATELGGLLYKNASIFMKTGRQRITKAVEDWQEQQRNQSQHQSGGSSRPRWMTESVDDGPVDVVENDMEKFADDPDEESEVQWQQEQLHRKIMEDKRKEQEQQIRRRLQLEKEARIRKEKEIKREEEEVYVSPSRRRGTPSSEGSISQSKTKQVPIATTPTPKVSKRTRPLVEASAEALSIANTERQHGNEQFKLGQFGDAEASYSRAIEALPSGHDLIVLLSNNRALVRLKIGEHKKCISDCEAAIEMSRCSGDGSGESGGVTIQWQEQIIKALHRKAEALEHLEKYQEALKVYEELVVLEGSQNVKLNHALARCRKVTAPNTPKKKPSAPVKKAASSKNDVNYLFEPPMASDEINNSKAVAEIRAKASQQEAEEIERLEKIDAVNAQLLQWKAGKEQNLRALLATLDVLLWPGAQWNGTQMSELINPKRCKIVYLKAIGKVHPDKLPSSVTVEQRMLASGIFSTLNEAWDSFKTQNNL